MARRFGWNRSEMSLSVGFLIFPDVQQLDLTGPYEVFATLPEGRVTLIGKTRDPVTASTGLRFTPDRDFAACPDLDVVCVPGGVGVNALLEDGETLDFLTAVAPRTRFVTSVCTGALVLGAAGLLHGKQATTHWAALDLLAAYGAEPVEARVVRDGNLITGGGVTAGIDFALTVVAETLGRPAAEAVQLQLEYAPDPPFTAGDPRSAPPEVVATVRQRLAPSRAARERLAERYTSRERS